MCMLLSSLNTVSDLTLSNITYDQGYLKDSKVYSPMLLYIWVSKLHKKKDLESNTLTSHPAMKV